MFNYLYMDTTNKVAAANIKKFRLARGLTQLELANNAGVSSNYYARFERGEVKPSADIFKRIAKALNVSSKDIFDY